MIQRVVSDYYNKLRTEHINRLDFFTPMQKLWATLGDQAVLAYCENESDALQFSHAVRRANFDWLEDVVQAYQSVAVFYNLGQIALNDVQRELQIVRESASETTAVFRGVLRQIPCCYELGLDWPRVVEHTAFDRDELILFHTETVYTVYAIGFCPGFPYLGYLPNALCGVPRLDSPRVRVQSGSVGLTGNQTGIYTMERPGGWNIVGRTPTSLVDVADDYFALRVGDRVQFSRIDEREFVKLDGERLK